MKNFIKSKRFIVSSLSVVCLVILAACWFVSREPNKDFVPEESSPIASQDWQETSATSGLAEKPSNAYVPPTTEPTDAYPKVVEVIEDESAEETAQKTPAEMTKTVVIDFTPTEKPAETPPPAPEGKTVVEDPGPEHPVTPAPEVTAPAPEIPASTEPVPGTDNGKGAVYDPAFGWVVPGGVNQSAVDSDGDPNKMVGNMGE